MPVTEAIAAYGVILKRGINGAGHPVAELNSIGGIEITSDLADVTSHESEGAFREKVATLLDAGSVPMKGNFIAGDADGQRGLETDLEARLPQKFSITFPPAIAATFTFFALVKKWAIGEMKADGTMDFEAELEITGQPLLSITASTGLTTPWFSVDVGDIVPAPAGAVYTYVVDIPTGETEIVITPTAAAGVITITANGVSQVVETGHDSTAIILGDPGTVIEATISVKETGKTAKVYTLYLARAAA